MKIITKQIYKALIYKILSVIKTSNQPASYLARGAFIGILIALTPTVGIQNLIIFILWAISHLLDIGRFNFKIAFLLTWITNYLTAIPIYFIFYYCGVFLGSIIFNWNNPVSYSEFVQLWAPVFSTTFREGVIELVKIILQLGAPLFLGCMPIAIASAFFAYRITLRTVLRHRARQHTHVPGKNDSK